MTAEQYLKDHGISEEFALEYGVAWDDNYLHIPVRDEEGELLFLKSRNLHHGEEGNTAPKYKNPAGSQATLFNFHAVKGTPNIFLCEGEIDCLKLIEEGIPSVSSTGGAGTFKDEWVELLKGKNIWVCYDNDNAGRDATRSLIDLLPGINIVELPQGFKDIGDFFSAGHSKQDFLKLQTYNATEWIKYHRPEKFSLIDAGFIEEMEVPEYQWLIKGFVYAEGFAFLYGAEGTGKSYITLSMAKAIATGTPWLGQFETNKAKVLFLDKENPTPMVKKRLSGLGVTRKEMGSDVENIFYLQYPHEFQLTDHNGEASEFAQTLSDIIVEEGIEVLVIDSFVDLVVGNENSSGDTQAFFNAIKQLYPDIAYITIHHENKPSQGVSRSSSQRLRGSTNISAQAQTMFRVERVAKSKTEMTLEQTKARDTMKLDKFMVRMNVKDLPDGTTTVSEFEYLGEIEENSGIDDSKIIEITEAIKVHITEIGFISRKRILELGTEMGASVSTTRRAIDSLVENNEISKSKEGREVVYKFDMFSLEDTLEELNDGLL